MHNFSKTDENKKLNAYHNNSSFGRPFFVFASLIILCFFLFYSNICFCLENGARSTRYLNTMENYLVHLRLFNHFVNKFVWLSPSPTENEAKCIKSCYLPATKQREKKLV